MVTYPSIYHSFPHYFKHSSLNRSSKPVISSSLSTQAILLGFYRYEGGRVRAPFLDMFALYILQTLISRSIQRHQTADHLWEPPIFSPFPHIPLEQGLPALPICSITFEKQNQANNGWLCVQFSSILRDCRAKPHSPSSKSRNSSAQISKNIFLQQSSCYLHICSQSPCLIRLRVPYSLTLADSSIVFMFWVCERLESYSIIPFTPLVKDQAKPKGIEY